MDYPINAAERRSLLAACDEMMVQIRNEGKTGADVMPGPGAPEISDRYRELANLLHQYRLHLPVLPVSRCPFTGQVVYHSIDPYGLDGYWWDYHHPIRSLTFLPSTLFSFSGALKLGGTVERTRFLCLPGPGVPFVIPELLRPEGMKAVIWSLPVGSHTGYPILYFADGFPPDIEPVNDWGAGHWRRINPWGSVRWNESPDVEEAYDFDLVPYIRSGRLLWIDPGDRTMTLRSGPGGCPYIDMKGERKIQRIQNGKVWTS